ncbi:NAD(P)-dependent dehydrogenase (short-subunit alcohol dehydrogenase family) [Nocardioides daedukensis]|uniref:NAD(P)-dependent dehydrogenase (Short-subunit alcohol dehydrogenase family) n=1 Tax=Nocardioides daedukensis TaxID=634462 RepID=A0A7Y9RV45_9ACTN|nr:NAD(P)-dependent dehydrogenase (short-subunit alcohol dehydrogenase family) [Nocardioides daedukensis]
MTRSSPLAGPRAGPLAGRTALVTGSGRGLGRAHALHLADLGASVVVNDREVSTTGEPIDGDAADEVVATILASGGRAIAFRGDCASFEEAERMVAKSVATFGSLDIVVNNAGILRDRMIFNMDADEWDEVVRTHLRGHAAPLRAAARHWRRTSAETGSPAGGRVINTVSESGLYGNAGQTNYSAAKAGIAALTQAAARELEQYGVTVNAVAPRARTRMVDHTWGTSTDESTQAFGNYRPEQVSTVVGWLAGESAGDVTGQVFTVFGDTVQLMQGWQPQSTVQQPGGFTQENLDQTFDTLFSGRARSIAPFPFDPTLVSDR